MWCAITFLVLVIIHALLVVGFIWFNLKRMEQIEKDIKMLQEEIIDQKLRD